MNLLTRTFSVALILGGIASAQSFNIDIGSATPAPSASFGAAAGQPGFWNVREATLAGPVALTDVNGVPTGVTLEMTLGIGTSFSSDNPATSGDDEALLDDAQFPSSITGVTWKIAGLAAGTYTVYTYAWAPDNSTYVTDVTVNGGPTTGVGGAFTGTYSAPITHALDMVGVSAGGNITIHLNAAAAPATNFPTFNGLQLEYASSAVTPFCDGSAIGTACTACGNNGAPGRGCANSSFVQGGLLSISGTESISADTCVLTASAITGPGLFFQADGLASFPIPFGDGELCASFAIVRLGVVFPTAAIASYPGGSTPSPIHIAGGPLVAGDARHYQCWYRDAVTFCTPQTSNLTQGLTIFWGP